MFAVFPENLDRFEAMQSLGEKFAPRAIATILEDEDRILREKILIEVDFCYGEIPSNISSVLALSLVEARKIDAIVAWFAFEGSFDFHFVLTKEIANQVYALVDADGLEIATDETIVSDAWAKRVEVARAKIISGRPESSNRQQ
jgi:hypothetical protein